MQKHDYKAHLTESCNYVLHSLALFSAQLSPDVAAFLYNDSNGSCLHPIRCPDCNYTIHTSCSVTCTHDIVLKQIVIDILNSQGISVKVVNRERLLLFFLPSLPLVP